MCGEVPKYSYIHIIRPCTPVNHGPLLSYLSGCPSDICIAMVWMHGGGIVYHVLTAV